MKNEFDCDPMCWTCSVPQDPKKCDNQIDNNFPSIGFNNCWNCDISCFSCNGVTKSDCIICADNYYRLNDLCVSQCPSQGYYLNLNKC
jgi:hypothetical protein